MFREDGQGASEWSNKNIVPVDCWGPAGTVVFYHSRLMHERGPNYSDNIRQAVLMRFAKTAESLPEEECIEHARTGEIWRDWSVVVRETPTAGGERPEDWTALTKGASLPLNMRLHANEIERGAFIYDRAFLTYRYSMSDRFLGRPALHGDGLVP